MTFCFCIVFTLTDLSWMTPAVGWGPWPGYKPARVNIPGTSVNIFDFDWLDGAEQLIKGVDREGLLRVSFLFFFLNKHGTAVEFKVWWKDTCNNFSQNWHNSLMLLVYRLWKKSGEVLARAKKRPDRTESRFSNFCGRFLVGASDV